MCPLCNQSVKENQLYPVATLEVVIEEFIKMKQDYLIDELTHLSAATSLGDRTLVTSMDIRNAQEREKERRAAETEESDLSAPQIQKECKILKKGERPQELNIPHMSFVDKVNSQMTHVVLPADKHNIVDRSLTYYLGVLYGCYVVNEQWLENSIKKGYPISESRYEISGDKEMGRTGAPEKARKNKESKKPNLFKGLKLCVVDDNLQRHVEKCILVGGGIIEDDYKN
ncbi:hypothetical protein G6F22_011040 [Rhizopus arrhizus]|nr:hypothetical protein G6F22_011040 [Rhizopus arrhizus]